MPSLATESQLVARSVVRVAVKPVAAFGDERRGERELSFGTGVVVGSRHVLTAWHVVAKSEGGARVVVRTDGRESASEMSAIVVARHSVLDLALLELERKIAFNAVHWLRGNPGRHEFSAGVFFCAYGFPGESGGQSVCCQRLPDKYPSLGFEVGTGKMVRLQLDKGLPEGYSGGPVMLHAAGQEACFGICRLGGAGAATSVIIPADEVLPFLAEHNLTVESVSAAGFLSETASEVPASRSPETPAVTNSVVNHSGANAPGQTNIANVGRDVVVKVSQEGVSAQKHTSLAMVAMVALGVVALATVAFLGMNRSPKSPDPNSPNRAQARESSTDTDVRAISNALERTLHAASNPVIDGVKQVLADASKQTGTNSASLDPGRSDQTKVAPTPLEHDSKAVAAARERSILRETATSALKMLEELEDHCVWRAAIFLPLETNLQGRLIASQPELVASVDPLFTNRLSSSSDIAASRLVLERALASLTTEEKKSPVYTPPQTLIEEVLEKSNLTEEALHAAKVWRNRVEAVQASARKSNKASEKTLREAIELSKLIPTRHKEVKPVASKQEPSDRLFGVDQTETDEIVIKNPSIKAPKTPK